MIRFYSATDSFGEFSNFYPSPITIHGISYATVEHFYQSQKFLDPDYRELIRSASTPNKAKILAHQQLGGGYKWRTDMNPIIQAAADRGVRLRPDWDDVRELVMMEGLQAKFAQHPRLAAVLESTGTTYLTEASPRDSYWGEGRDGTGLNRLGVLLMRVRAAL
jgi:hypothetical protein